MAASAAIVVGIGIVDATSGAIAAPNATPIQLLYHADLDGRFAEPNCRKRGAPAGSPRALATATSAAPAGPSVPASDYARLVGVLAGARATAEADGAPAPIALLGGNLATPDLPGRALVESSAGVSEASTLAAVLARARYDAVALGHHDLSLQPRELDEMLSALVARGIVVVATNLTCDAARAAVCARTRPSLLVHRGAIKVGVLATLSPSVLAGIAAASRRGLALGDPGQVIRAETRRLRALGAARVVVMTQGPRDLRGREETDTLQRSLERRAPSLMGTGDRPSVAAEDVPDVILAGGLSDEETDRALRLVQRDGAPPVVGSEGGARTLSRVLLPVGGDGDSGGVTAVDVLGASNQSSAPNSSGASAISDAPSDASNANSPTDARKADASNADASEPEANQAAVSNTDTSKTGVTQPDAEVTRLLGPAIAATCASEDVQVSPGRLRAPLSRDAFVTYALEVMRRRARAEIALLNHAAVRRGPFPITGTITRGDLQRALPYRAVIGWARMTGGAVESVLGRALCNEKVAIVGLTGGSGGLQVNGRALDKGRAYRVATIAFVAAGGDAIVPPDGLAWHALDGEPDLRATVEEFLRTATAREDGDAGVDPKTDFGAAPFDRPLLVGLSDFGADVADTRIANAPSYGDAQLARANQQVLKLETTEILQLRHPIHEADTRFNLQYGWTRSQPMGAPAVSGETTDLITFSTVYNYRGLRTRRPRPRREIPDPYARVGVESELTRPPVSSTQPRTFHHLELTNTAGALFTLTPALKLRGGAGARKELLAGADPSGRWRPVLEAGGSLSPFAIASFGPTAIRVEGLVDYTFVDPAGAREHQVRGSGKLSVSLLPMLFITAGLDLFAVERERLGWAASYDTTIGLRVHLDAAHQWM